MTEDEGGERYRKLSREYDRKVKKARAIFEKTPYADYWSARVARLVYKLKKEGKVGDR